MRNQSAFGFVVGLILAASLLVIGSGAPRAQTCPVGTLNCPFVEPVGTHGVNGLRNDASNVQYVYTSGYYNEADGGGGVLYKNVGLCTATPNGGTLVANAGTPVNCYVAQTFPQNVLQWGAYCDATRLSAPGVITSSPYSTLWAPGPITLSSGEPIVVTNALAGGGTLATTVNVAMLPATDALTTTFSNTSNSLSFTSGTLPTLGMLVTQANGLNDYIAPNTIVTALTGSNSFLISTVPIQNSGSAGVALNFSGTQISLNMPYPTVAVPQWVPITVSDIGSGGTSHAYNVGDTYTLTYGGQPQADVRVLKLDTSTPPQPKHVQVINQYPVAFQPPPDSNLGGAVVDPYGKHYTLSDSPSGPTSGTSSGLVWYGHDDSTPINTAIGASQTSVTPPGSDIYLPANRKCGVTTTVLLPAGVQSVRGYGANSSSIVALANMPQDGMGLSYVLRRTGNNGSNGGGARELGVEGLMLASDTCGIQGGQNQVFESVLCSDGMTSEWRCGGDNTPGQMAGDMFLNIQGDRISDLFPFLYLGYTNQESQYNWFANSQCTWSSIVSSRFDGAVVANIELQNVGDWDVYTDDQAGGGDTSYCVEVDNREHFTNLLCKDPILAAVHLVTGDHAVIQGVDTQWINSLPGAACIVLLESGVDHEYIAGLQGRSPNSTVLPGSNVCSNGAPGVNDIITGNTGSSVVVPGAVTSAPVTAGQVYLSLAGTTTNQLQLCPANGPGGLIINGVMQQVPAGCAFLPSGTSLGASVLDYIYAESESATVQSTTHSFSSTDVNVTVLSTAGLANGDQVTVSNVSVTTEANGTWLIANLNTSANSFDLVGAAFQHGFSSCGGSGPPCGNVTWIGLAGLTASANLHETLNGVEVNTSNPAQTLVGMAWLDSSSAFNDSNAERYVASWYNRQPKKCILPVAGTIPSTAGWSPVNPAVNCQFTSWTSASVSGVNWAASGTVSNLGAGNDGAVTSVGFNGSITPEQEQAAMQATSSLQRYPFAVAGIKTTLGETRNTMTLLGQALTGGTAQWWAPYTTMEITLLQ